MTPFPPLSSDQHITFQCLTYLFPVDQTSLYNTIHFFAVHHTSLSSAPHHPIQCTTPPYRVQYTSLSSAPHLSIHAVDHTSLSSAPHLLDQFTTYLYPVDYTSLSSAPHLPIQCTPLPIGCTTPPSLIQYTFSQCTTSTFLSSAPHLHI